MTKNKKYLLVCLLSLIGLQTVTAQQYPMQYMYDRYKYSVNPAALKIGEGIGLNAAYSNNQFSGIDNNSLFSFGVDGGFFHQNMGVGLFFSQENQGILQNTNAKLQYAYRVLLAEKHFLTFGIAAGILYEGQNTDKIITGDYSDPLIGESYMGFSGGFGMNYKYENLEIDASIPSYNTVNPKNIPLFASAAYTFYFSEKNWGLKPIAMYNGLNPQMNMFDFRVQGSFKDFVWAQVGYRTSEELLFALGGNYKNFQLGAAYGFNLGNYADLNKGNFEIVLGYRFANAKTKPTLSQKEINTQTQQSLSEINSNLSTLKTNDEKQTQELQQINKAIQQMNNELTNEFRGSLNEIKETMVSIKKEELEHVDETKILSTGYFVVVYSTTAMDDAEKIVQRMKKQDVTGYIIKDSKRNYYYIYTGVFDDLNAALAQSQKERSKGFSGAWVLISK